MASQQVDHNRDDKISIKFKFQVPSKLPDTLSRDLINHRWKRIIAAIENKRVEEVLEEVKSIGKNNNIITLPHPFKEDIVTYATKSTREGMCNFIFFVDENHLYPWILCQCTSFVDAIFTNESSAGHKLSTNGTTIIKSAKKILREKNNICRINSGEKGAKFSGFILDQTRPYHHFYDQLKWFIHLESQKPITSRKSFFIPNCYKVKESKRKKRATVSLFPLVIGSNQLGTKLDKYTDRMEQVIYEDSVRDLYSNNFLTKFRKSINILKGIRKRNSTLSLWFGISGQKRIWIEQEEFLPALVDQLKPFFDSFIFVIDGYTQYANATVDEKNMSKIIPIQQDMEVVESIRKKLLNYKNTTTINLVGKTYREKIQICRNIDLFIANAGAGQLVPHRFCKKPGILHSNEKHCVFPMGIDNTTVKLVDKSLVKDVGNLFVSSKEKAKSGAGLVSYSIDVQVMVNITKTMLNLLS